MDEDLWDNIDVSDVDEGIPKDIDKKIVNYQAEAGKNVNIYLTVDDVNVYITDFAVNNGKVSYQWFTYKELDDNDKKELEKKIDEAITKLIQQQSGNKWSLRKLFSRIYSTIANILARFFRT